jgi:hypothetical protein
MQTSVQGNSVAAAFTDPVNLPADLERKRAYSQIGRCACGQYCRGGKASSISGPYLPCAPPLNTTAVRECGANACCRVPLTSSSYDFMGYTMRTATRRFTAWVPFDNTTQRVDWNKSAMVELYNLANDTGRDFDFAGYSLNLATSPTYRDEVASLTQDLRAAVQTWY